MKKKLLLVLFCIFAFLNKNLRSQSWTWDAPTSVPNAQKNICVDAAGNLYMYGNSYLLTWSSATDTILKTTVTGQSLSKTVLPANMSLVSLVAAPDTGIYMGGTFSGTLTFANTTYTSRGANDIWIARYNKNGALLWMNTVSSSSEDNIGGICVSGNSLILTGTSQDTINFMGQIVPKNKSKDLFVSIISNTGALQNIKFANATNSPTLEAFSIGQECKVDPAGNIYVLAVGAGLNKIDTFRIAYAGAYDDQSDRLYCQTLIKFNNALQPQFVKQVYQCFHFCYPFNNLQVSSTGESYLMNLYSYGQSGNDDLWSRIYKFSNTGTAAGIYRLRPERNSVLTDMALDCFDNLYFTGYSRPETNHIDPHVFSFAVGKLTPSFTLDWLKQDSLDEKFICGNSLAVFGNNDVFVNGVFRDTVQLLNTITTGTNGGGFYARITAPGVISCAPFAPNTTGLHEIANSQLLIYPNPTSGRLIIQGKNQATRANFYSVDGKLLAQEKISQGVIDVSYLQEGLYFVQIFNEDQSMVIEKIVVGK